MVQKRVFVSVRSPWAYLNSGLGIMLGLGLFWREIRHLAAGQPLSGGDWLAMAAFVVAYAGFIYDRSYSLRVSNAGLLVQRLFSQRIIRFSDLRADADLEYKNGKLSFWTTRRWSIPLGFSNSEILVKAFLEGAWLSNPQLRLGAGAKEAFGEPPYSLFVEEESEGAAEVRRSKLPDPRHFVPFGPFAQADAERIGERLSLSGVPHKRVPYYRDAQQAEVWVDKDCLEQAFALIGRVLPGEKNAEN
ncbi:MAG: hypothetical protein C4332_03735 [Meiothermus sp.]